MEDLEQTKEIPVEQIKKQVILEEQEEDLDNTIELFNVIQEVKLEVDENGQE